jgi:hypothetical protein
MLAYGAPVGGVDPLARSFSGGREASEDFVEQTIGVTRFCASLRGLGSQGAPDEGRNRDSPRPQLACDAIIFRTQPDVEEPRRHAQL